MKHSKDWPSLDENRKGAASKQATQANGEEKRRMQCNVKQMECNVMQFNAQSCDLTQCYAMYCQEM